MKGAFYTGQYRNVFAELGHSQKEIDQKLKDAFHTVFYGPDDEKFYFEAGDDMGYFEDTGNFDARTEGMSYAMMMCVQMDMKNEFDRVWKWARTYMYMEDGYNKGYFAWSCKTTGEKNDLGPAPDGEEFFAMALFFASHRWGDGEGIFNYSQEARNILSACIHNGEKEPGDPIMEPENYLIRFIPSRKFSDPSYHCAHFYELFSMWANEEDRPFWKKAAKASREYLKKACHKDTGLAAEYAYYDGTPYEKVCQFPKGIERIFPQDVTSFQHGSGPYGSRFPVVVNDCRCLSEHVVFFQHQAPCLTDGGEPFFIFSVLHGLADDFKGFLRVVQRDGDEAFLREAFRCQRIPGVKGKGHGDKGIRQFFRPMVGFQMVFHA